MLGVSLIGWILFPLLSLLGVLGMGIVLWRYVFPQSEPPLFLSGGVVLGAALASVWLANVARYGGWEGARWSLFLGGMAVLAWLVFRFRVFFAEASVSRDWKRGALLVAFVVCVLSFSGGVFDEVWHFPLSALFANGVWPTPHPFDPTRALTYHFGFDVLVGYVASFGWPVALASDIWQALLQVALVGLVWEFFRSRIRSARHAVMAMVMVFFVGTIGWLLKPVYWLGWEAGQYILPFHGSLWNPVFLVTYTKSALIALGALVAWFVIVSQPMPLRRWALVCLLPICLAAVALSSETIFVGVVPFLFLGHFAAASSWSKRGMIVLIGVLGVLLSVSSGGLIRDAFMAVFSQNAAVDQINQASFSLRKTAILQTFGAPLSLFSLLGWLRLIVELGGIALLAWYGLRSYFSQALPVRFMIIGAGLCLLLPLVITYPVGEREFLRLWLPAFFLLSLAGLPVFLAHHFFGWKKWFLIASVIGGVSAVFLSNLPFGYWLAAPGPTVYHPAFWKAALDPRQRLASDSVLWVSSEDALDADAFFVTTRQAPVVFGVPVQTCLDLFSRKVSDVCDRFQQEPSLSGLQSLQVTHVLLGDAFVAAHAHEAWFSSLTHLQTFHPPSWMYWFPSQWWRGKDKKTYALFKVSFR